MLVGSLVGWSADNIGWQQEAVPHPSQLAGRLRCRQQQHCNGAVASSNYIEQNSPKKAGGATATPRIDIPQTLSP